MQITGGEYIQMSGRAGRRGLDERGIVIMIVDEKLEPEVGKSLLKVSMMIRSVLLYQRCFSFFNLVTETD